MPSAFEVAAYLRDHYGECTAYTCVCSLPHNKWLGCGCPNWRPLGATTYEGLREAQMRIQRGNMIRLKG